MTRQIRRLGLVLVALFVVMFAQMTNLQVLQADRLAHHPGNTRDAVRDFGSPRGSMFTVDGREIARSVPNSDTRSKFKWVREYPARALYSHVIGYFSFTYGSVGLERTYNALLAGRKVALTLRRAADLLKDRTVTADLTLTIDDRIQRSAAAALGRRPGSVVALDPKTGAILAMVSYPRFDPNPLAGVDQEAVQVAFKQLSEDPAKPLLARAYREVYPPGSTFKTITTAAGLGNGSVTADTTYPVIAELPLPLTNRPLRNFGGRACGGTLAASFAVSCNTSFARLGLDLGARVLHDGAVQFGFTSKPPLDVSPGPVASRFPSVEFFTRNTPALAQSAIGQGEVAATPLEMALVAAGIANGGKVPTPHLLKEARERRVSGAAEIRGESRSTWTTATSPEVAAQIRDFMVQVVEVGTGRRAAIAGVAVAAKTGTAQTTNNRAHAWTIAFAPADDPLVAVAVIVEDQPEVSSTTGGRVAAPVARAVMQEALAVRR